MNKPKPSDIAQQIALAAGTLDSLRSDYADTLDRFQTARLTDESASHELAWRLSKIGKAIDTWTRHYERIKHKVRTDRCAVCNARLARGNPDPVCRPCSSKISGVPIKEKNDPLEPKMIPPILFEFARYTGDSILKTV